MSKAVRDAFSGGQARWWEVHRVGEENVVGIEPCLKSGGPLILSSS